MLLYLLSNDSLKYKCLYKIMCRMCWKEFTGWCKSFTKTEFFLSVLEALLLMTFITLLVFVVLHFLACGDIISRVSVTTTAEKIITHAPFEDSSTSDINKGDIKGPKCTWKPSLKTEAVTRYYERDTLGTAAHGTPNGNDKSVKIDIKNLPGIPFEDDILGFDKSDGEEAQSVYRNLISALVKMRPPNEPTFGCVLTIVSEFWAVTAASCVEAIEETDSLDSFVMIATEGSAGPRRGVASAAIHPRYRRGDGTSDLAALRGDGRLARPGDRVDLPKSIDYSLMTIGERLTIVGFGKFRGAESGPRSVGEATVYKVPARQCAAGDAWSPRHLARPPPPEPEGALCAGVPYNRGAGCNYCAGAPLLRARTLLGVMADNRMCGVACEPALYVNMAEAAPWLESLLEFE